MPDPFAPKPCADCGTELPYKVHAAREYLYDGYQVDPTRLAEKVAEGIKGRERTDKYRAELNARYPSLSPQGPITEREIGEFAVDCWVFDGFDPDDLTAAVAHFGDLGHTDGTACERANHARWCHEPTPGHGGWDDKRPTECTLEAGHEGAHRFEYETAAVMS